MTIASALVQRNVDVQIVIADDGSENFPLDEILDFFNKNKFRDFVLCISRENHGTVQNIFNGIEECKGEYVKDISPGDYLYGESSLSDWVKLLRKSKAAFSICDAVYYCEQNGEFRTIRHRCSPQINKNYFHNQWFYNYLIFNDIGLGACMLCKTSLMKQYLSLIKGKVKFAEDNIFRLMAADKVSMTYFHNDSVLYEYGTGISTSCSEKWLKLISNDWKVTNQIIYSKFLKLPESDELNKNFKNLIDADSYNGLKRKIFMALHIEGFFFWKMNTKFKPKYTNTEINMDYVNKLIDFIH